MIEWKQINVSDKRKWGKLNYYLSIINFTDIKLKS